MTVTRVPASNPEPEVPITDPRWLASTQPDRGPEPKPWTHWMVTSGLPMPQVFNACGAPSGSKANSIANQVTCPACLDASRRLSPQIENARRERLRKGGRHDDDYGLPARADR